MAQTQSVNEHLTAVRDELKAASEKRDEEAKTRINAALAHAQQAQAAMKAQIDSSGGKDTVDKTMAHLNELSQDGKKALEENGQALQVRIQSMMGSAKNAIDSNKVTK